MAKEWWNFAFARWFAGGMADPVPIRLGHVVCGLVHAFLESTDFTGGAGLPAQNLVCVNHSLVIVKMLFMGEYDIRLIKHPISIAIYIYLASMLLTVITSQLP